MVYRPSGMFIVCLYNISKLLSFFRYTRKIVFGLIKKNAVRVHRNRYKSTDQIAENQFILFLVLLVIVS